MSHQWHLHCGRFGAGLDRMGWDVADFLTVVLAILVFFLVFGSLWQKSQAIFLYALSNA